MKIYESLDFCKYINCLSIQHPRKIPCMEDCCQVYQYHTYLRDRGQILEEGSELAKVVAEVEKMREVLTEVSERIDSAECRDDLSGIRGYVDDALADAKKGE